MCQNKVRILLCAREGIRLFGACEKKIYMYILTSLSKRDHFLLSFIIMKIVLGNMVLMKIVLGNMVLMKIVLGNMVLMKSPSENGPGENDLSENCPSEIVLGKMVLVQIVLVKMVLMKMVLVKMILVKIVLVQLVLTMSPVKIVLVKMVLVKMVFVNVSCSVYKDCVLPAWCVPLSALVSLCSLTMMIFQFALTLSNSADSRGSCFLMSSPKKIFCNINEQPLIINH